MSAPTHSGDTNLPLRSLPSTQVFPSPSSAPSQHSATYMGVASVSQTVSKPLIHAEPGEFCARDFECDGQLCGISHDVIQVGEFCARDFECDGQLCGISHD